MPRSYRYIVFAAVGWLTLGNSQQQHDAAQPEQKPANHPAQSEQPAARKSAIKPINALKYKAPCREPQNHDSCQLEADWKAADAADRAAWWAVIQAWLSLAGIIGLIVSLHYTRKAVLAAEDATKDADKALAAAARSADAAERQIEISEDTAMRQLRAYIAFREFMITMTDRNGPVLTIHARIKNTGRTPALGCYFWGGIWRFDNAKEIAEFLPSDGPPGPAIGAGQKMKRGFDIPLSTFTEYVDKGLVIVVMMATYYNNAITGQRHEERFAFRIEEITHPAKWQFKMPVSLPAVQAEHLFKMRTEPSWSVST